MTTATPTGVADGKKATPPPKKRKPGRPSKFTQELADELCRRLCERSLTKVCEDEDMPGLSTVLRWLGSKEHDEFRSQYAHARAVLLQRMADDAADIADQNPETVPVYDREGKLIEIKIDSSFEMWRRTRIDTRKWMLSKLVPKVYGDKVQQELSGPEGGPVSVSAAVAIVSLPDVQAVQRKIREKVGL